MRLARLIGVCRTLDELRALAPDLKPRDRDLAEMFTNTWTDLGGTPETNPLPKLVVDIPDVDVSTMSHAEMREYLAENGPKLEAAMRRRAPKL